MCYRKSIRMYVEMIISKERDTKKIKIAFCIIRVELSTILAFYMKHKDRQLVSR